MRVWLPYEGPPLWDLVVTSWCEMDIAASARSTVPECDGCDRAGTIVHDPEAPLVVKPDTWPGTDFFRMREMDLVFVCERVKQAFDENGFTNLDMKKCGFIPDELSEP
jgi:hypothetical protein